MAANDSIGPTSTRHDSLRVHLRKLQRHPAYLTTKQLLRSVKAIVPNAWRLATHRHRQLPAAVIVGAQKAGTTQLYSCLVRHPRCFRGVAKEIQYFSKYADRSLRWYRSQFPLTRQVQRVQGVCLDASPSYLPMPQALWRMRDALPNAKVIVLLRDPVARAFSHYQHEKTRHRESRTFAAAVEDALQQPHYPPQTGAALRPDAPPMCGYVSRGYYALQLEVLYDAFPREQVQVLDSADLFNDTNAVCQRVFDFLGLERLDVPPTKIYNRGYYRESIDTETAAVLREHYRPYDQLMVNLLGRTFRWMEANDNAGSTRPAAA